MVNHSFLPSLSSQSPIGVFDSGVGGTTVLRKLTRALPGEKILYFADTANLPYGDKTPAQILAYSMAILDWMAAQGVKMVVVACHTSSALAYPHMHASFSFPILDVIQPFSEALLTHQKTIGVFATLASLKSEMHKKIIQSYYPEVEVFSVACPEWVSIIESGQIHQADTTFYLKKYLEPILEQRPDALVYGCTHYPLLENNLKKVIPNYVNHLPFIDPADALVDKVIRYLAEKNLLNQEPEKMQTGYTRFYTTGDTEIFAHNIKNLWGYLPKVTQVHLPVLELNMKKENIK